MRRWVFIAVLMASSLRGQMTQFHVEPIAFAMTRSGGDLWHRRSEPISLIGYGVYGVAETERLRIETEVIATHFIGLSKIPQAFSPEHGFSWLISVDDSVNEFGSDYTNMKLSYKMGDATLHAGKYSEQWGPGMSSLFLSEKSPSFPRVGFDWPLTERVSFSYVHGELFSGIRDLSESDILGVSTQRKYQDRFIAAHRLQWRFTDRITMAFNEAVVYGNKGIETMYLMPFILFFSAEHFSGDADNILMQFDAQFRATENLDLYGAWFLEDWEIISTFNFDQNQNHFGFLGGIDWSNVVRAEDRLLIEGSWTDSRIYRHIYEINFHENRGYPMGHWTGAHAQSFDIQYELPLGNWTLQTALSGAKRGKLTEKMLEEQYNGEKVLTPRFEGNTESYSRLALHLYRRLPKGLWLEAGVSALQWKNAGFDPAEPGIAGEDQDKVSVNLGIYHNFTLPGYPFSRLRKP